MLYDCNVRACIVETRFMLNQSIPEGYGPLIELEAAVTSLTSPLALPQPRFIALDSYRTGSIRAHTRMRWCMTLHFHGTGNMYPTDHSAR